MTDRKYKTSEKRRAQAKRYYHEHPEYRLRQIEQTNRRRKEDWRHYKEYMEKWRRERLPELRRQQREFTRRRWAEKQRAMRDKAGDG